MFRFRLSYKLYILWQMSWGDRWIVTQSWFLMPLIACALSLVGLNHTQRYLAELSPVFEAAPKQMLVARQIARAVNQAANHNPVWGNCLKRSLALWFLLRKHGIVSDLRIGVRRHEGEFQAHAWVEYHGEVLNDQPTVHQTYVAFKEPFTPLV